MCLLSSCSRKTPRIANRLLRRIRDFANHKDSDTITLKITKEALNALGIDDIGLNVEDRDFLKVLVEKFSGRPVGLSTLAIALSEEKETIEEIIEPYMIQIGFVERTPRGRMATQNAYKYLGVDLPEENKLF